MAIVAQVRNETGRINMSGRFDFTVHREFKGAYTALLFNEVVREIEVEMRDLNFLDSSALGMLMLLRERAEKARKKVALINPTGTVLQLLEVACFDKLFELRRGYFQGGR